MASGHRLWLGLGLGQLLHGHVTAAARISGDAPPLGRVSLGPLMALPARRLRHLDFRLHHLDIPDPVLVACHV